MDPTGSGADVNQLVLVVDRSGQFFAWLLLTTTCTSWTPESYVRSINCAIGTIPNWLIATPRMIPKRIFFMILLCAIGEIEPTVNDTTTHYKAQRQTILRHLSTCASEAVGEAVGEAGLLFHHGVDPTRSGTGVNQLVLVVDQTGRLPLDRHATSAGV